MEKHKEIIENGQENKKRTSYSIMEAEDKTDTSGRKPVARLTCQDIRLRIILSH